MHFKIEKITDKYILKQIFKLRYRVFTEELNRNDPYADETLKEISDDFDGNAHHFAAFTNDKKIIASVRVMIRKDGEFEKDNELAASRFFHIGKEHLSYTSRLVVDSDYRRTFVLRDLIMHLFKFAIENKIYYDFIYCQPSLVFLYERLGYRRYKNNFRHPYFGYETPMILLINDIVHLQKVKSPFAKLIIENKGYYNDYKWFHNEFPDFTQIATTRHLEESNFWQNCAVSLYDPRNAVLFNDFTKEEIAFLLKKGFVIKSKKDDIIIKKGERGRDIFFIIDGEVEIKLSNGSTVAIMSKGDFFGEISYFTGEKRSADVIARQNATLVVFTSEDLLKFSKINSQLSSKLYYNLASVLAGHLIATNKKLEFSG